MSHQSIHLYEFGPFWLDVRERLLLRDGESVPLTPKAFDLLLSLVEHHGHLLEKDELMKLIWPDTFVEESNLSSNISHIRRALGDGENGQKFIETVPKRGYRFVADVREAPPAFDDDLIPKKAQSHVDATQPDMASSLRKRTSRWAWPAAFLAAGVIVGAAVWLMVDRQRAKTPAAPARIVPFTSFAGSESQPAFSPDGKQIAFVWGGESDDNNDIYVKLIGTEKPLRLTTNPASDSSPTWSPDGRYIAYQSDETGKRQVYVQPYPGPGGKRQVSAEGGFDIRWSRTGHEIIYRSGDRNERMMAVDIDTRPELRVASQGCYSKHGRSWVSADGTTTSLPMRSASSSSRRAPASHSKLTSSSC